MQHWCRTGAHGVWLLQPHTAEIRSDVRTLDTPGARPELWIHAMLPNSPCQTEPQGLQEHPSSRSPWQSASPLHGERRPTAWDRRQGQRPVEHLGYCDAAITRQQLLSHGIGKQLARFGKTSP